MRLHDGVSLEEGMMKSRAQATHGPAPTDARLRSRPSQTVCCSLGLALSIFYFPSEPSDTGKTVHRILFPETTH